MTIIMKRYIPLWLAVLLLIGLTGCSKQAEVVPPKPQMGVLNMAKAVKSHPLYADLEKQQGERAALLAQLSQQEKQAAAAANQQAGLDLTNLGKATEQKFQTKMAAKQEELKRQLQAQADASRRESNAKIDQFVAELDRSYQDRNFALQLKLKMAELSQEEQATINQQIAQMQNERTEKIVAYQQELTDKMNQSMKQAEQAAAKTLDSYANQLKIELDSEYAQKAQELKVTSASIRSIPSGTDSLRAKLESTDSRIVKLQQDIIADIAKRAASVAVKQGLTTVLADVEIFTASARDITEDVIAGSK